ncbi:MAG: RNA polymerase sigma-70 factor [Bacteroidia bacterium]|nr:RNA polymerase sigma-70 factor [Bacteroidia bacterium]
MNENDAILISGLNRKNINAYRELFFKYHGRLVLFANKFTGDIQVSQDLVQDAFLKLWEKELPETIESPKSYLFQAVKNSCLNHHRHINIKNAVEKKLAEKINAFEKSGFYDINDPLHSLLEHEIGDKVEKIVQSMPEKCREIFRMSRRDFLKNKQIALEMGISEKMVEKHISKALALLRKGLSDYLTILLILYITTR